MCVNFNIYVFKVENNLEYTYQFICTYYWCLNINNLYIYIYADTKNIHIYISMCEYYINIFRLLSLSLSICMGFIQCPVEKVVPIQPKMNLNENTIDSHRLELEYTRMLGYSLGS